MKSALENLGRLGSCRIDPEKVLRPSYNEVIDLIIDALVQLGGRIDELENPDE